MDLQKFILLSQLHLMNVLETILILKLDSNYKSLFKNLTNQKDQLQT